MPRLLRALNNSLDGLKAAAKNEWAFRVELISAAITIPLAIWLGETKVEIALLIATVLLVLIVELLNTAVEACIDRISDERHPIAKIAKDTASAAVLISLILTGMVWTIVLFS